MLYDIVQVIPYEDYTVYVYFEDGKIVCYDAKPLLDKKVFAPLKNIDFFMNATLPPCPGFLFHIVLIYNFLLIYRGE